jgi:hypothetical protein
VGKSLKRLPTNPAVADILAICRYFEELYPDPALIGRIALSGTVFGRDGSVLQFYALPGPDAYEQIPALAPNAAVRESNIFSPRWTRGFWAAAAGARVIRRLTHDETRRIAGDAIGASISRQIGRFLARIAFSEAQRRPS